MGLVIVLFAFLLIGLIPIWLERRRPTVKDRVAPGEEPCWTEKIGSNGRYSYSRSGCFNEELSDLDARASRGDFPVPQSYD